MNSGSNGFSYRTRHELDRIIAYIACNIGCLETVASEAKKFIDSKYSAKVAAKNLVDFVKSGYSKSFP